jgi:Tol biopolymer transport system component
MKRCPECRRDYYDDSLLYCLDDGSALLDGPTAAGELTAMFGERPIEPSLFNTRTKIYDAQPETSDRQEPTLKVKDRRRRPVTLLIAGGVLVVIAGAAFFAYRSREARPAAVSSVTARITRLTTSGKSLETAISPDGKWVVYAQKDGDQQSLWMRQTATNSAIQIVPSAAVQIGRETFSPDGNYVYYFVTDASDPSGVLYQAPTIGGPPKKILNGIASPVTFSPDGKRIAFIRNDEVATAEDQLIVANADGTGEHKLAARKGDEWFGFPTGCGWSPDGRVIACAGGRYKTQFNQAIIITDVESGEEKELATYAFSDLGRLSWLSDGSGLLVNAAEPGSAFDQIWSISYPGGEARKITNDLMDYAGTSLTADSTSLVSVQTDKTSNIWTAPVTDLAHPKQITSGKFEGGVGLDGGLSWAPDGRIIYTSLSSGNPDIWIMKSDGSDQRQLTADPSVDVDPVVSPDGRYVVFVSNRSGTTGLWRMDLDGGNAKLLSDLDDHKPQISPDSKWIIFDSWRSQRRSLWKMPMDGGEAIHLTDKFTSSCGISPDGQSIACFYRADEQPGSPWRIMILPFDGGGPQKTFDFPMQDVLPLEASLGWTADGKAVTYVTANGGTSNLWSQPLSGGAPKKITDFKEIGVWGYAWWRYNNQRALSRGSITSDVVLIKDFR